MLLAQITLCWCWQRAPSINFMQIQSLESIIYANVSPSSGRESSVGATRWAKRRKDCRFSTKDEWRSERVCLPSLSLLCCLCVVRRIKRLQCRLCHVPYTHVHIIQGHAGRKAYAQRACGGRFDVTSLSRRKIGGGVWRAFNFVYGRVHRRFMTCVSLSRRCETVKSVRVYFLPSACLRARSLSSRARILRW